jgi:hypothetical protein
MKATTPIQRDDLADYSECCIRKWAAAVENRLRERAQQSSGDIAQFVHSYVAVSAEAGIEDEPLAGRLAQQFGWECVDSKLLDYIVQHYDWDQVGLDYADEHATAWFRETFGKACAPYAAAKSETFKQPGPVFYLAAHSANHVFVDPLAPFYLPGERGLTVRLIAPKEQRFEMIAKARNCSRKEAATILANNDHANAEFVNERFRKKIDDPRHYDLVINLVHTSLASVPDLVVGAYMLRFRPARSTRPFEFKAHRGFQRI